jgi:hypothetical protein
MKAKGTDGGAREWSREEKGEGNTWMGDETTSWTTGPVDHVVGSGTSPTSDVA